MLEITHDNIEKYSQLYENRMNGAPDEIIEAEMKAWLRDNRYLDREKFIKIGMWKTPRQKGRYESNENETVQKVTTFSLKTSSEQARIKSLFILNGVSYPVASAILHFAFPEKYPILDFRVLWSLGMKQPNSYTFEFWMKYCERMREISNQTRLPIRTIDKALWEYSKRQQTRKEINV